MWEFPELNSDPGFEPNPSMSFYMKTRDVKGQYRVFYFSDPELMMYFARYAAGSGVLITDTKIHFYNVYMMGLPDENNKNDRLPLSSTAKRSEDNRITQSISSSKDVDEIFKKINSENQAS